MDIKDIIEALQKLEKESVKPFDSTWHPDGFSLFADEEGAVRVKKVDEHAAKLPKSVQDKLFKVWYFRDAYEKAAFPSEEARMKAHQNLSWRLWTVFLFPPQPSWNAVLFEVRENELKNEALEDFFKPPSSHIQKTYHQKAVRFDAGSMDWDPAKNAEYVYSFWRDQARDECYSQNINPGAYGL